MELKNVTLKKEDLLAEPSMNPGEYLMLSVKDTGEGIKPEVLPHIFDPYFTTKDIDKGSGMGLAVVHGIVRSHEGMIEVESTPGVGSEFRVYFPVVQADSSQRTQIIPPLMTGHERILVVDDEMSIVEVLKKILEGLGYTVTTMTNSVEALGLFEKQPEAFDLIVTDQTMPCMTGNELAQKVAAIRPDIPVVLCTGYSSKVNADTAKAYGVSSFLMKPASHHELAMIVRQVLDGKTNKK
nr:response regulator [Desulfobulbaceae bacterium]